MPFCPGSGNRDKRGPFVPIGNTNRDRLPDPGQKEPPLLSRPGVPGWETGTTKVSQPGQISLSVVVNVTLTITKIIPMILQRDIESDNNIMPMLSKYLLLFLVPYDNMLIIITGKNSSRVPFQTGLS